MYGKVIMRGPLGCQSHGMFILITHARSAALRGPVMQSVLLICELNLGIGHLSRMMILGSALSHRFRVVLVVLTEFTTEIESRPGIEVRIILRDPSAVMKQHRLTEAALLEVAGDLRPDAIIVEYFPFGRLASAFFFLPFFRKIRALYGESLQILSSIRDIDDCSTDIFEPESILKLLNKEFDGVLVHSDPEWVRIEDMFPATSRIQIPVYYTNYVSRHSRAGTAPERSQTILVSAGGGRGGEALLHCAAIAAKAGLLRPYRVRIIAGKMLLQQDWNDLLTLCADAGDTLELLRWVPDLYTELRTAMVSVSRCGYNTTLDLLASGIPALVVPVSNDKADEQVKRARLLADRGVLRMLPESEMTPESLAAEILHTITFQPAPLNIKLDGAEQTCDIVSSLTASQQLREQGSRAFASR